MPRGGARPGAGRKPGSGRPPIRGGLVRAIQEFNKIERQMARRKEPKTPMGYRVPADVSPEAREAADFAFGRLIDVAAGKVNPQKGPAILKAAVEIRKEVCGPIAIKVEQDIGGRLEKLLTASMDPPALPEAHTVTAEVIQTETPKDAEAPLGVPATPGSG